MSLYKRGDVWWVDLRHRGRRVRRTTGTADRQRAQRHHDELAARLWQAKQAGRSLSDALLIWLDERPRGGSDLRILQQIRAEYPDRPLIDVTHASLLDTWGGKSPGTYNRIVSVIRAALRMAHARGWVESAPAIPKRVAPRGTERWLTAEEWDALYAELPAHLQPLAAFSVATGLRWSNASGLTWDRVDLKRRLVWIPGAQAKGGAAISVPLSAAAIAALRASGAGRTGLVFRYAGRRIGSPKTGFFAAIRRAAIPPLRWHDLRHTWASWHVMSGTPLAVLQQLGGWATAAMVQRYAHLAPSHVAQFAGNARPHGHTMRSQSKRRAA